MYLYTYIFTGEDMTNDEIINLAIENTIHGLKFNEEGLLRFAKLVAFAERSACVKAIEDQIAWDLDDPESTAIKAIQARGSMTDKEHKVGEYIPMPKQEPVGWAEHGVINWLADKQFNHTSFLYDTPADRKWMSLTDKEIEKCWQAAIKLNNGKGADITNQPFYFLAKIVEELLMEKNT